MILPRLITAIVGVPLILITIKFGGIPYFILIVAIVGYALKEYFYLLREGKYDSQYIIGYILGILLLLSIYLNGAKIGAILKNQTTAIMVSLIILCLFLREIIRKEPSGSIGRVGTALFGIFVISWTLGHLLLIRDLRPSGKEYTFYLFILIWSADTAAYGVGTKFGKSRLAEKISPKKSIEGALGGISIGIIVGIILWKFLPLKEFRLIEIIIISFIIIVLGYISDLAESLIKRDTGIKDTDRLLPGHGGILDRFDSFLFTAPFFYYYLSILH